VSGTHPVHPIDDRYPQATTNPVWVFVGGRPVRTAESAQYFIRWIDKLIAMTNNQPGWRSPAEKAHVLEQFGDARRIYERLFVEAKNSH
ncbi:MAG TPA: hypothetical protein VOA64_19235, partial [Candidatus Dormibacteraeota bacterium]|nr:hypothetical protein [Candidatus Dormibacteraeota bacterium]